jgi:hypothetical protein
MRFRDGGPERQVRSVLGLFGLPEMPRYTSAVGLAQGPMEDEEADVGNRTPDLLITSELLCQLSYVGPRRYARTAGRAVPPRCLRAMDHRNGAPGRGLSLVAPERLGKVAARFPHTQARHHPAPAS